jgi:hypothetical protein
MSKPGGRIFLYQKFFKEQRFAQNVGSSRPEIMKRDEERRNCE